MYVGILRVHDASRCAPLRKILKDPVTAPKKIAAPLPAKKTPLSFDIGKTTVLHTATLRLCSFLARHFCSNVGTIVLCQLRRCKARHLRDSRKRFHFLRQALSCRVSSAKEYRRSNDSVSAAINEKARGDLPLLNRGFQRQIDLDLCSLARRA